MSSKEVYSAQGFRGNFTDQTNTKLLSLATAAVDKRHEYRSTFEPPTKRDLSEISFAGLQSSSALQRI